MNTYANATMGDDDIHAFREPAAPRPVPAKPRRRVWPWVLGGGLLMLLLIAFTGAGLLMALVDGTREGFNLSINGEHWDLIDLDPGQGLVALAAVALALVIVLLVVPVMVSVAVLLGLMAAALGLGAGLLAVVTVAAVVLSPLWLVALLVWLLLRRRPAATIRP